MKEIKFKDGQHIEALRVGVNTAVDLAKQTLGGKGKLIMIDTPYGNHSTSDGVSVIQNVQMKDRTEQMGVNVVLEAASKQVAECGDGTTSVSVLLQAIINEGFKNISAGSDSLKIRKGIELAAKEAVQHIKDLAKPVQRDSEEIRQIAKVSAHGDDSIADLVFEAISKTTANSIINVKESPSVKSYVDINDGMKVMSGWLSKFFITNENKGTAELPKAKVLVYEGKIYNLKDIVHLLAESERSGTPLVIVSDNMDGEVLGSMSVNANRGMKIASINPFGFNKDDVKNRMHDLATYIGTKVFSPDLAHKLEDITFDDLGECDLITISQNSTIFEGGKADDKALAERVETLESLIKKEDDDYQKQLLKGRLAAINGGVGTIFVGGVVGSDAKERLDRVDDAKGAALASLENGIVPGGGISLLHVSNKLEEFTHPDPGVMVGVKILTKALLMPISQILTNAGLSHEVILNKINESDSGVGYNVVTDKYVNMIDEGILDPAKVEINIIQNASTIASNFLNTAGTIAHIHEKE